MGVSQACLPFFFQLALLLRHAADALTKLSLHPIPLHEARAAFPDL
jgi:hypothetical protein